ncbi:MAG: hypothetical protein RBG13Loki_3571, partial [Promethearchaeota archaeon CR_4]
LNEVQVLCFHRNPRYAPQLKIGIMRKPPSMEYALPGGVGTNTLLDVMKTCTNDSCPGLSNSSQFSIYTRDSNCFVCGAPTRPLHRIRIKLNQVIYRIIDQIEQKGDFNLLNPRDFPDLKRGEEDQGLQRVKAALQAFMPELCAFVTAKNDFSLFSLRPQKSLDLNTVKTQKDPRFYAPGPKLLIKHNSIIPEACYTEKAICFTAAIYSLLFPDDKILKYLCGILNSKLMQFYCIFGINNQNLVTMNLNQYMIRHLPIIAPHKTRLNQDRIIELVEQILEKIADPRDLSDKQVKTDIQQLDQEIYALYGITGIESINLIEQSVEASLRSFSRTRGKK